MWRYRQWSKHSLWAGCVMLVLHLKFIYVRTTVNGPVHQWARIKPQCILVLSELREAGGLRWLIGALDLHFTPLLTLISACLLILTLVLSTWGLDRDLKYLAQRLFRLINLEHFACFRDSFEVFFWSIRLVLVQSVKWQAISGFESPINTLLPHFITLAYILI